MKIVHIITTLTNGGAEGVLYRLVSHDKTNEHIVISLMDEAKYGPLLKNQGIKVYCLGMSPGRPSISSLIKLYKILKKSRPDIVQTWMYHADLIGGIVAKSLGINKVFWNIRHSTFDPKYTKSSTYKIAKICAKLSSLIPHKIISCSETALNPHINMGYAENKFIVINNGYNLNTLKINKEYEKKIKNELNIGESPLLGMVGRYNPQKNHKGLIKALEVVVKQGYDFELLLVGRDVNNDNLELLKLIEGANLENKVHMLGSRNDIPAIMNALDIHILNSSYGEGFPNVVAEAMACGTPCIATNIGDSKLILNNYGQIIKPDDIKKLSQAIIRYLELMKNNPEKWLQLRLNCADYINDNFSIEVMINQYNEAWRS